MTDQEIARELGCAVSTLYLHFSKNERFSEATKKAKHKVDGRVQRTLLERASGYTYTEQQAIKVKQPDGSEIVEIVEVTKHVAPDPTAMIFWLKNRQPKEWRDKTVQEQEGTVHTKIEVVTGLPAPNEDLT